MQYHGDKIGSKFVFIAIFIVIIYLAFFNFDLQKAYDFTVGNALENLHTLFTY